MGQYAVLLESVSQAWDKIWLIQHLGLVGRIHRELPFGEVLSDSLTERVPRALGLLHVERVSGTGSQPICNSDQIEVSDRFVELLALVDLIEQQ